MIRTLTRIGKGESVLFDDVTGLVKQWHQPEGNTQNNGVFFEVSDKGFAVYADGDELMFQCEENKFDLSEASVAYHHDWDKGTTTFSASEGAAYFEITYPAWWVEAQVTQDDLIVEPELNRDEDLLNWVFYLTREPQVRKAVGRRWRGLPPA